MNSNIFRAYDIRGIADTDLDDETALNIGRAFGSAIADSGGFRVALGRDARKSSLRIRNALCRGITESGVSVSDIGLVPTPVTYFAANYYEDIDGLVMITGSHNPPDHNGLKLGTGKATMGGKHLIDLKKRIEEQSCYKPDRPGTVEYRDSMSQYIEYLSKSIEMGDHAPNIVIDAGNGTGGLTIMPLLKHFGIHAKGIFLEPDGEFPNHEADPTVDENLEDLRMAMKENGADLGIAYDGDADRIGVIDKNGDIIRGDNLLMLFSRDILSKKPGGIIVGEVKCSQILYDDIEAKGGRPIMWKTGHTLIKSKMKEEGALLGGEMSGHLFFADRYFGFDDACYATLRLLEILSRTQKSIGELLSDIPPVFNTPEIRVDCPDEIKFSLVNELQKMLGEIHEVSTVDGVRVMYPDGWGLVRASNTQPILVLRFEAESEIRLNTIRNEIESYIEQARKKLEP